MSLSSDPRRYYASQSNPATVLNPWTLRLPLLVVSGLLLMFFMVIASLAGYQFMYQDKVYPGISTVYGLDLTGMTRDEVRTALQSRFAYAQDASFVFTHNGQSWEYTAAELGVQLDLEATVDTVFAVGRSDSAVTNLWDQWQVWRNGQPVSPVITYNQSEAERLIRKIASDNIDQPILDATLTIRNHQAIATPSQVGRVVDVQAVLDLLRQEILGLSMRSEIQLIVREQAPAIQEAQNAANLVNIALDTRGVTFFVPNDTGITNTGPWTATAESIENMLRIERVENGDGTAYYDVKIIPDQTEAFLRQIAPELRKTAINARFTFNDDTRQLEVLQPSQNGYELDVANTIPLFQQAVFDSVNRNVPLAFIPVPAFVNESMTAAELGITEEVVSATTYFVGSTSARRTNIDVAASRYHGLVIAPGAIFSFNEWLGDVSPETGFAEGLIIYGNQTITGVGGGVCQVSTTVFQAAFYGGFPIVERYPHGYRVSYYETGEGPGMDATVYSPIVDFKFRNDTPYHLLLESYYNGSNSTVTFKIYSTDTGRSVTKDGPYVRNVRPAPAPVYRATAGVTGTVQVDYAVSGAEVYVYRTIRDADGNVIVDNEQFYSNYIPWPAQYQVPIGDSRAN